MNKDLRDIKLPIVEVGIEIDTIISLSVVVLLLIYVGIISNIYLKQIL